MMSRFAVTNIQDKTTETLVAQDQKIKEDAEKVAQAKKVEGGPTSLRCARCKHEYLEEFNTQTSCIFHPGAIRRFHPKFSGSVYTRPKTWVCCNRVPQQPRCRQRAHIDDRKAGLIAQYEELRKIAEKEASNWGICSDCNRSFLLTEDILEVDFRVEDILCNSCQNRGEDHPATCAGCGAGFMTPFTEGQDIDLYLRCGACGCD